jgi:hypothetical protein
MPRMLDQTSEIFCLAYMRSAQETVRLREREIDVDLLKAETIPREFDFFDVMVDVHLFRKQVCFRQPINKENAQNQPPRYAMPSIP